jgi:hypothetical protein
MEAQWVQANVAWVQANVACIAQEGDSCRYHDGDPARCAFAANETDAMGAVRSGDY